jgi:hypothetical protein
MAELETQCVRNADSSIGLSKYEKLLKGHACAYGEPNPGHIANSRSILLIILLFRR